ncbi:uncharacterized protein Tco025E_03222 [Trypanosoma conorhini]|uniref:FHA domain-containing protein n=1 Tax=Trypanosoma conorhini TaxID=83891 RepID=A0A422PW09_9TRYP|nr:uncharacterized protein Tco025E_03222 [Trypanosoma conorhini]RNF21892.1 hypothetical protein Tco025E_03222 [Trypanosoma conorhini]
MLDYLCAELVLSKGPETLPRRIPLRVPTDSTPVMVGRAAENDIVLSAHLLFASQRHCQLIARPVAAALTGEGEGEDGGKREKGKEKRASGRKKKPVAGCKRGRGAPQWELCLVDVGSSNGTFVNGDRVEVNALTPLHHGDTLVLGGMRDVEPGAALPADAVAHAPEIVTWRVVLNADAAPVDCVSTPSVVLHADFVEAEEKRIALELLQRMTSPPSASRGPTTTATPPPTVLKRWKEAPSRRQRGEELDHTPRTPAARVAIPRHDANNNNSQTNDTAGAQDGGKASTQRSGTVAAAIFAREESLEDATPPPSPSVRCAAVCAHSFSRRPTTRRQTVDARVVKAYKATSNK